MSLTLTSSALVETRPAKPLARYATAAARILFGLMFLVFGLNGFLNFIPPPATPMPERAMSFIGALLGTGYMLPLIAGTKVVSGVLLLTNRLVPLALLFLAPLIVNIVAFHVFLEPSGLAIAIIVLALEIFLVWTRRAAFLPLVRS